MADSSHPDGTYYAEKLASVLASRKLSLYRVSRQTEEIYGRSSPYFVPHNYYSEFTRKGFSPSIYQLAALSRISGYRLLDWLRCFGLDVEAIQMFQIRLPSRRTQLLNSLFDAEDIVPVFKERSVGSAWPDVAPLSRLLTISGRQAIRENSHLRNRGFIYAKIGLEDAMSFPVLAPESVVRADPQVALTIASQPIGKVSERVFLVEHSRGYVCSHLRRIAEDKFSVVGFRLPYAEVDLLIPPQARILGIVDLEVRSLVRTREPDLPTDLGRRWRPGTLARPRSIAQLLKEARRRMRLSLPAASALTHRIGSYTGDDLYSIATSTLSDYEATEHGPRHIQKIISLCAVYGLQFTQLLRLLGLAVETFGSDPMPQKLLGEGREESLVAPISSTDSESPVGALELELADLPLVLKNSTAYISGLSKPTIEDFFWIGGEKNPLHPVLHGSMLAIVNRRKKRPAALLSTYASKPSLFVLLKRNGNYVCAPTTLEDGYLSLRGYPHPFHRPLHLRNRDEAEVVGEIVALVRSIAQ